MWIKNLTLCTLTTAVALISSPQAQASGQVRNGLPPCNMDSFVHEAHEHAEEIYGDEGTNGPPPYMGFDVEHRINTGIMDQRDQGLTTGHGSRMPRAVGRDEFLGQEWSQSGPTGAKSDEGPDGLADLPPSPGPGYEPMYQNDVAVGWWSPAEIQLLQTDVPAALRSIVNSNRYYGGQAGKDSILYEIGDISSPSGGS